MIEAINDTASDFAAGFMMLTMLVTIGSVWVRTLIPGSIWLCAGLIPLFLIGAVIENINHRDTYTAMFVMTMLLAVIVVAQKARQAGER